MCSGKGGVVQKFKIGYYSKAPDILIINSLVKNQTEPEH
jgi:hypothetical protein